MVTFLRHRTDQQRFSVTVTDRDGSSHTLPNTSFAFVLNTTPWTYLGGQVIETNPGTLASGLGILRWSTMGVARAARRGC